MTDNLSELPKPDEIFVHQIIDLYLQMGTSEIAKETRELFVLALADFRETFGSRRVVDCRAVELLRYFQMNEYRWKSAHTRLGRLAAIKRAFNWAWDLGLLTSNPFARVKIVGPRTRRKPMTDDHYQAILRNSPPLWRRAVVFLRFAGCRTKEMASLRWKHIDIAKGVAVLPEHKTARKTGKPRIIPLPPVLIKLLVWMKTHRQVSVTGLLERFLATGPKRIKEVVAHLAHYGVTARSMHRARMRLGVKKVRIGGTGPKGYWEYHLPDDYTVPADPILSDLVFMTSQGYPLNKSNMNCFMARLRRRGAIPKGVSLYCLRHAYGLRGIKNRVPIKLVSLAMGHASVTTTEIYVDGTELGDDVAEAAIQINHGPNAKPTSVDAPYEAPKPQMIEVPVYKAAIGDMHTNAIFLPSRNGDAPKPVTPISTPPPPPATQETNETLMRLLLEKLKEKEPKKRERSAVPAETLTPAQQAAWDACNWAIEQDATLAQATDPQLFAWLKARPDCPYKLPPMQDTFRRYLSMARLHFDCRKRVLTTRTPLPPEGDAKAG